MQIKTHPSAINIAIMCPSDIYGRGHGPAKTRSALIPYFVKEIQKLGGKAFYYNEGANTRSWVHINDLMRLYVHVVEAAASNEDAATYFNENGYYFAGTQEWSQIEVARATGAILHEHGVVGDKEPVVVSLGELDTMANTHRFPKLARYLFASNSRTRSERAEKLFEYKAEAPGLMEVLESDVLDAVKGAQ
jgi:nucleoside-diphosphate-sugar epimerase